MTNRGRRAVAAALVGTLTTISAGRVSAQGEQVAADRQSGATIVLHVTDYADLPRQVLDEAGARVSEVYKVIGVRTVWVDAGNPVKQREDVSLQLHVMLLSRDMAQKKISAEGIAEGVLGQAHLPSGRAYIFCERIATMPGAPMPISVRLGNAIAHEVGHLVLRTSRHSNGGIMRENMNGQAILLQSFDENQARTIRTTMMEVAAGRR